MNEILFIILAVAFGIITIALICLLVICMASIYLDKRNARIDAARAERRRQNMVVEQQRAA